MIADVYEGSTQSKVEENCGYGGNGNGAGVDTKCFDGQEAGQGN
jgi:hypothetical protein